MPDTQADVLRVGHDPHSSLVMLAGRYGVSLVCVTEGATTPGSYWGESEAGLRGDQLYVRPDTPLHSLLHELGHYVCMFTSGEHRAQRLAAEQVHAPR